MKEVELLLWLENLKETNPQLYGGIAGFAVGLAIGLAVAALILLALYFFDGFQDKRNEKVKGALSLIGKQVTYKTKSLSYSGTVATVDFELLDTGRIKATIGIDTDCFKYRMMVDYREFNKSIMFEKEE